MPVQEDRFVRFADFVMDRDALELRRAGVRLRLQIQPFRMLEALIEQPGQVRTRDELRSRMWPARACVDFDHGLNNAVARLREALGDSADHPRFIETLPRIGYRFIYPAADVHVGTASPAAAKNTPLVDDARPAGFRFFARSPMRTLIVASVIVLAGLVTIALHGRETLQQAAGDSGTVASEPFSANAEAWQLYVQGRHLWNQRSPDSVGRSASFFKRAIDLDPDFAAAYAGLADAYVLLGGASLVNVHQPEDLRDAAIAAAARALELDDRLPESHSAMARALAMALDRDVWGLTEEHYLQALRLKPSFSDARLAFGNFLSRLGRQDEAIAQFREALRYDPVSPNINSRLGKELVNAGHTEEGIALMERAVELAPWQFNARVRLAWNYILLNRFDDAEASFAIASQVAPGNIHIQSGRAYIAAKRGDITSAAELLEELQRRPEAAENPFPIAMVHVAMLDREGSLEWLEKSSTKPLADLHSGYFRIDGPTYDWLRDDPRFVRIAMAITE